MSMERRKLKEHIENILKRKDSRMMFIYQDNDQFMELFSQIDTMNFTLCNLSKSLQAIARYLFRPGEPYKTRNVDALLLYSMKLDEYLITNFQDYQTDLLVETLVNILIEIDFAIGNRYCNIL